MKLRVYAIFFAFVWSPICIADMAKANSAIDAKDFQLAEELLLEQAIVGNADAQLKLGISLYQGNTGQPNKVESLVWLTLAADQQAPNAEAFASQLFAELPADVQKQAVSTVKKMIEQYGQVALQESIYPTILNEPIESQMIKTPAKLIKRGELVYESNGHYIRQQQNVSSVSARTAGTSGGTTVQAYNDMSQDDSGKVTIQFDINQHGRPVDPVVIYSNPKGRFDQACIDSLYESRYEPAKDLDGNATTQHGVHKDFWFGIQGGTQMRDAYPRLYEKFRELRYDKDKRASSKYLYASLLRSHNHLLATHEQEAFEVPLLEAARSGLYAAQLDYGRYEIYENSDIETGVYWLKKAAVSGYMEAEYAMGDLLSNPPGRYLYKNNDKALFWLKRAAEKGHHRAIDKFAELALDKDASPEQAKYILGLYKSAKKYKNRNGNSYYQRARAYYVAGKKSAAKKEISKSLKFAKKHGMTKRQWVALAEQIRS